VSNLLLPSLIPKPILSGFGIICSSALSLLPAPNCISSLLFALNLETNLLDDFINFNKYGVSPLNPKSSGSFAPVFSTS